MSYDTFKNTEPGVLIFTIIISIALTAAFYCVIPLLIASLKKKPTTVKSYRLTCFLANIVVIFLFTAINGSPSSGGYWLWTWVFSVVGVNILRKRNLIVEKNASDPNKFIVTSDMHKFICNNCQTTHTGWYNECPNCKAVGTLRKGSEAEIRKWNNIPEVTPPENPIVETNTPPEPLKITPDMHKFICNNCQATYTGWHRDCPNCKAVGSMRKGTDEEIRKWNAPPEVSQSEKTIFEPKTPTADVISPVPITATTIKSTPAYCKNCGTKLFEDSIFCQNCGTKVI